LSRKCHLVKGRQFVDSKSEYKWTAMFLSMKPSSILIYVSGIGTKHLFTIARMIIAG